MVRWKISKALLTSLLAEGHFLYQYLRQQWIYYWVIKGYPSRNCVDAPCLGRKSNAISKAVVRNQEDFSLLLLPFSWSIAVPTKKEPGGKGEGLQLYASLLSLSFLICLMTSSQSYKSYVNETKFHPLLKTILSYLSPSYTEIQKISGIYSHLSAWSKWAQ